MHYLARDLRPWWEHPITVVDCETTGVDHEQHRIIEVAAVRFERGQPVRSYSSLVSSVTEVSEEITGITGIRSSDLIGAPPFYLVVPHLYSLAHGSCVAAYNADFDQKFFLMELQRSGLDLSGPLFDSDAAWLDPLVWVRHFERYAKGKGRHKLAAVCERRGVALDGAHRAAADAEAAGRVLYTFTGQVGGLTLPEILLRQRQHAVAQEREYQEWRARKDAAKDAAT